MSGLSRARGGEQGTSLVELLVVMVLLSVVGGIAVSGVITSMRVSRQTEARITAFSELQTAAERISRDVRGACPLQLPMDGTQVTNRVFPGSGTPELRIYRYDATARTLLSSTAPATGPIGTEPEQALIRDVEPGGDVFTYLGADGGVVTAPADVRSVQITLRRSLAEQPAVELQTLVSLRNGGRACD